MKPLTCAEIMKAIPDMRPGSFVWLCFQAGVRVVGGEVRNNRYRKLYEGRAIEKIKKYLGRKDND